MTTEQADVMIALLTDIRNAVVPPAMPSEPECECPEERRTYLGDTWVCRDCRRREPIRRGVAEIKMTA